MPRAYKSEKEWRHAIQIAVSEKDGKGASKLRRIAEKVVDLALAGEAWAAKEIGDRLDGKATERVELTGKDGAPLFDATEDERIMARYLQGALANGNAGKSANPEDSGTAEPLLDTRH